MPNSKTLAESRITCWEWCSQEHAHNYGLGSTKTLRGRHGQRGVGGARVVLSAEERKSIERQIGVPVTDAQDARQKMRERGFRFIERGESGNDVIDANIEYAESGAEARGIPASNAFPGWGRTIKPFNHEQRLQEHIERHRARHGSDET